ncbi:MAG: hypothetical protein GX589_07580 [Deltaproteobacteria bacterium]|nr:hypothetical protein [Deltaproteobacteria bacterium]
MSDHSESHSPNTVDQKSVLQDPLIKRVINEDPLFRFLFKWRRPLVWALVLVACLAYIQFHLNQSRQENKNRGADLYAEVRKEFLLLERLDKELADKKDESDQEKERLTQELKSVKDRLNGKLDALQDQKEPYRKIGQAYRALTAVKTGDPKQFESLMSQLDLDRELASVASEEALYVELPALLLARALLDHEEGVEMGKRTLRTLSQKAKYVRVSAALTLSTIAQSEGERAEALALLQQIQKDLPEQGSLIEHQLIEMETATTSGEAETDSAQSQS